MIVTIDAMKEALGLPTAANPTIDPVLERSSLIAQTLVESYIGLGIELDLTDGLKTEVRRQLTGVRVVRARAYPATLSSAKLDDATLPADQYTFDSALGVLEFKQQRAYVDKLELKYGTGWDDESVPKDIIEATLNIALAIYENGGRIAAASTVSGALKSMTMFDAMSMSFETGSSSDNSITGPESLVSQWAFVLDKYKVDGYVMV
jgi:hypothetical protein